MTTKSKLIAGILGVILSTALITVAIRASSEESASKNVSNSNTTVVQKAPAKEGVYGLPSEAKMQEFFLKRPLGSRNSLDVPRNTNFNETFNFISFENTAIKKIKDGYSYSYKATYKVIKPFSTIKPGPRGGEILIEKGDYYYIIGDYYIKKEGENWKIQGEIIK